MKNYTQKEWLAEGTKLFGIEVNAPAVMAQGVKEQIAMELEKFGDVRVVSIRDSGQPIYRQEVLHG